MKRTNNNPIRKIAKGAVGITKSVAGIDRATNETIRDRKAICKTCPEFNAKLNKCKKCGCALQHKLRINGEKCPLGKW